jgi:hypothetical protein
VPALLSGRGTRLQVASHRRKRVWQKQGGTEGIQQLISKTAADGNLDVPLQYIDLRLGNTCNMECIMCQPRESSRWPPAARKLSVYCQNQELKREWRFKSMIDASRFEWYRNAAFWENLKTFLPPRERNHPRGG